jgi:tol-pal system protein YbgF
MVALVLAVSFVQGAQAQRVDRSAPVTQGVTNAELSATVERLRTANSDMLGQIMDLEAASADLTGKVETTEFLLSQTQDELNRQQIENDRVGKALADTISRLDKLESRLRALESAAASPTLAGGEGDVTVLPDGTTVVRRVVSSGQEGAASGTAPTSTSGTQATGTPSRAGVTRSVIVGEPQGSLGTLPASALPGEAGPLFAEAQARLLKFDYEGAEIAFEAFLEQFGDDPQAAQARYWLGEVLYQQGAYAESGAAFTEMLRAAPDDPRAPEALVKLARSLRLVGEPQKACTALTTLAKRYPNASTVTRDLAQVETVRSACAG